MGINKFFDLCPLSANKPNGNLEEYRRKIYGVDSSVWFHEMINFEYFAGKIHCSPSISVEEDVCIAL